jgi:hypothetical protein
VGGPLICSCPQDSDTSGETYTSGHAAQGLVGTFVTGPDGPHRFPEGDVQDICPAYTCGLPLPLFHSPQRSQSSGWERTHGPEDREAFPRCA